MAARCALRSAGMALALALGLSACGRTSDRIQAPPEPGDQAVARVDGKVVWASDVKREAVAQGLIGHGAPLDPSSDVFREMLDEVVDQRLLAAEAVRQKLDKAPEAERRLAAARDRVLGDILVERTVAEAVNEKNVRELYDEQQKLAKRGQEIHARQIVLATAAEAEQVKKLLAAGASFEGLAMARSRDAATRFNGGDLGYFTTDVMPEAYAAALAGAKAGQVVGPAPAQGGYALLKVEDVREEPPVTLQAARPQIIRFLTYDRIRDLLEKLRAQAKVQMLLRSQAGASKPPPPADAPPQPLSPQSASPQSKGSPA